jgi:vesicle coat complex subunit
VAAVNSDTISVVTKLSNHRKASCRAAAAGALMSITINCDAKKWIVRETGLLDRLVMLLDDKDEAVLLNSVKALANCAEDYRGRFQLSLSVGKVVAYNKSSRD